MHFSSLCYEDVDTCNISMSTDQAVSYWTVFNWTMPSRMRPRLIYIMGFVEWRKSFYWSPSVTSCISIWTWYERLGMEDYSAALRGCGLLKESLDIPDDDSCDTEPVQA